MSNVNVVICTRHNATLGEYMRESDATEAATAHAGRTGHDTSVWFNGHVTTFKAVES